MSCFMQTELKMAWDYRSEYTTLQVTWRVFSDTSTHSEIALFPINIVAEVKYITYGVLYYSVGMSIPELFPLLFKDEGTFEKNKM